MIKARRLVSPGHSRIQAIVAGMIPGPGPRLFELESSGCGRVADIEKRQEFSVAHDVTAPKVIDRPILRIGGSGTYR